MAYDEPNSLHDVRFYRRLRLTRWQQIFGTYCDDIRRNTRQEVVFQESVYVECGPFGHFNIGRTLASEPSHFVDGVCNLPLICVMKWRILVLYTWMLLDSRSSTLGYTVDGWQAKFREAVPETHRVGAQQWFKWHYPKMVQSYPELFADIEATTGV